ncbi:hypothetical protein J5Y03_00460, partial [Bacillus sp. RG28]
TLKVDGEDAKITNNSYTFTNVTSDHTINVTFKKIVHTNTITATAGSNGTISPIGSVSVDEGTDQTFTITPDSGYEIDTLKVDGEDAKITNNSYTFTNVTSDHTINVTFKKIVHTNTITATAGSNGTISPSGSVSVNDGKDQMFTITPNSGYEIDTLKVDGEDAKITNSSYTFTNVTSDHTINVTFKKIVHTNTITATAGSNGTISPSGSVSVNDGKDQMFTITPNSGYEIDTLKVDGVDKKVTNNTYSFTNVTSNHTINVTFKKIVHTITATVGSNGTISPSGSVSVNHGTDQTFTITPNSGYEIDTLKVDGVDVKTTNNTYRFTNVTSNHTINVTFKKIVHTITATAGSNGTISPIGSVSVNHGTDQTFTITPNSGYEIDTLKVDGLDVKTTNNIYKFTNVTINHTINVTFKKIVHTITATAGSNGTISPSGNVSVNHGTDQTFTITPNSGYEIDTLKVDGLDVKTTSNIYKFTNVTINHTINVTFKKIVHTITATAGSNGTISPSGNVSVNHGTDQTFTIMPNSGYEIDTLKVDGVDAKTTNNTYKFTNVTINHTINVTFKKIVHTITATAGSNGTISPSGSVSVNHGTDQTFTITTNSGYEIDTLKVDDVDTKVTNNTYTFTNITSNHTINVTFKKIVHTITATAGSNGTISPSGSVSVDHGTDQTFTITPNSGYEIDTLKVDGVDTKDTNNTYTFTNIRSNHMINVTFKKIIHTITATAGNNGLISPSGIVSVDNGKNQTFIIKPNMGYEIDTLKVDGVGAKATNNTYTFSNITSNHTITVTFKKIVHTIKAIAGSNGTINPSSNVFVNHGKNQTFTIKPNMGYEIETLKVDGVVVKARNNTYTFTNVTSNHTITVTFKKIVHTIKATAGSNGKISPSGSISVNHGKNQTFTIKPNSGYKIDKLKVDGVEVKVRNNAYTFINVTSNHTIIVTFKKTKK